VVALSRREQDEACAFFVVPGQVIEILFLRENVILRDFFPPREAPEDDRRVNLGSQLRAALGVDAVLFAFAALLCCDRLCAQAQKDNRCDCPRSITHTFTSTQPGFLPLPGQAELQVGWHGRRRATRSTRFYPISAE
jgi:hypothetical protein